MSDEWTEVLSAPLEQDLAPLNHFLRSQGIPTWVFELDGRQCFCVPTSVDPGYVQAVLLRWKEEGAGIVDHAISRQTDTVIDSASVFAGWKHFPFTIALLLVSLVVFLMTTTAWGQASGGLEWLALLTLQPMAINGDDVQVLPQLPSFAQIWRLWTPVFLHFNFFHILFNSLMMLELGRRIETVQGTWRLVCLMLFCASVSNLAQFFASPASLFGGMSGVVYGLIGYAWLYQRLRLAGHLLVAPGLMGMALFWQALCFSGLVTFAGLGNIANAAHVSGMLAGLLCGWVLVLVDRRTGGADPGRGGGAIDA